MKVDEKITVQEAAEIYRENHGKIVNTDKTSFVSLQNINKIYPNNVQAVYDFNLDIDKHDFVALVGPSGCGKSTTLRMIAGLEEISTGELYINQIYSNYLESKDRDIAMVFQSYALYPQLSVYDNIGFGLTIRKDLLPELDKEGNPILDEEGNPIMVNRHYKKSEIEDRVFRAAEILDLTKYLDRKPKELSGGQMQRVALGRAIVRDAKLFLMDEPLSNLDAKLRVAMRSEIVRLHESIGATTIYVTHDQTEAMTMATRIVIMSKGWVQQVGTPTEVYENPKNLFVATFIGSPAMNIVDGRLNGSILTLRDGYEIDLGPDFINKHDDFYKRKIVECEEMLNTLNNEVEVKCYTILQEVRELCKKYAANRETIEYLLSTIVGLARGLNKKSRDDLVGAAEQVCAIAVEDGAYSHDLETAIIILNNMLVNYETINNGDIEKIHSAQAFQKESAVKADDTLVYKGRKHEFFWHRIAKKRKAKALKRRGPKVQIEDPEGYLHDLKAAYERALVEGHNVKLGIRPENVFLAKDNIKVNATKPFTTNVDVVELMGSEALVHSKFNGIDFLAKITSGTPVESHEAVEYVLDKDKIHIFDVNSGETII